MEPALVMQIPSAQQVMQAMMPVIEMYQRGDKAGAINAFLMGVAGPEAPKIMERVIPGSMKQAYADADTLFQIDFPSVQSWNFSAEDAKRIKQPVLSVSGAETVPWMINEVNELVRTWFPQAEAVVIPNANHGFPFINPKECAEALSGFFVRHPLLITA
jgi:pimeloyl-ACP methyl ester carboxylesterase